VHQVEAAASKATSGNLYKYKSLKLLRKEPRWFEDSETKKNYENIQMYWRRAHAN